MHRALLVCGIFAMVGCGISAVATRDGAGSGEDTPDAKTGPNIPDTSTSSDATLPPDAAVDAGVDSGITFAPSHLVPTDYSLAAGDVNITDVTKIDTTAFTVALNDGPPAVVLTASAGSKYAVWSVHDFTMNARVEVIGSRPLVIVASNNVSITGPFDAAAGPATAATPTPGPGGFAPNLGPGKGNNGAKSASGDVSGGSGAGGFTAGGGGGKGGAQLGTLGGTMTIMTTTSDFVGGSGGGNGGGVSALACGRGGNGGGAVQISAIGTITFNVASFLDVSGGGGAGGCSGDDVSAGAGGGAGGVIFLEAIDGVTVPNGATLIASGGGGGEGGDPGPKNGDPGHTPDCDHPLASGGRGGPGGAGNGGNGGSAAPDGGAGTSPTSGQNSNKSGGGGGGGAIGRVFLRARGADKITVNGAVYAASVQDPSF